jgi:hypothetical protein
VIGSSWSSSRSIFSFAFSHALLARRRTADGVKARSAVLTEHEPVALRLHPVLDKGIAKSGGDRNSSPALRRLRRDLAFLAIPTALDAYHARLRGRRRTT